MIDNRELCACVLKVLRQHGEAAEALIIRARQRPGTPGDEAGVSTWLAIATRMDQLVAGPADVVPN